MEVNETNSGIIIYARMGSKRLPGKALKKIGKHTLLEHIILRVSQIVEETNSKIIVATTTNSEDDLIEGVARSRSVNVFRGHPTDLVRRTIDILEERNLENFCRVNGDCPFVDPELLKKGYNILKHGYDFVSNILIRSFPYGVAVEWVKSETYLCAKSWVRPEEKEHVTQHLYRNISKLNAYNIKSNHDLSHISLTIDTQKDLEIIRNLFSNSKIENDFSLTYQKI